MIIGKFRRTHTNRTLDPTNLSKRQGVWGYVTGKCRRTKVSTSRSRRSWDSSGDQKLQSFCHGGAAQVFRLVFGSTTSSQNTFAYPPRSLRQLNTSPELLLPRFQSSRNYLCAYDTVVNSQVALRTISGYRWTQRRRSNSLRTKIIRCKIYNADSDLP